MKTKLKYNYQEGETTAERLRNKLSPFFTLVAFAEVDEGASQALKDMAKECEAILEDLQVLVEDVEIIARVPEIIKYTQNNTLKDADNV